MSLCGSGLGSVSHLWVFDALDELKLSLVFAVFILNLLGDGCILFNQTSHQVDGLLLDFIVLIFQLLAYVVNTSLLAVLIFDIFKTHILNLIRSQVKTGLNVIVPYRNIELLLQELFVSVKLNNSTESYILSTFLVSSQLVYFLIRLVLFGDSIKLLVKHIQLVSSLVFEKFSVFSLDTCLLGCSIVQSVLR